ncbi:hypothetical protein DM860_013494 [Cuscuta australis]|uniref:RING-type domain-containing protein n=1 Tax=Cuscuta australis TaxID=267555 RepID=A0A328D4H0_9ASTE|nr:hypothetical protein DM860_013494 [Cuscuta australis]
MGQHTSKDELLYQQVNYGNIEGIKALRGDGAGLEWIDKEGKTPLILACMNPQLYNVANTLIELGANINAYRTGRHAGTPLHHAAKRGLEKTVNLLLSHGANALVINDDCQTPLDVARVKGFSNVVRALESHMCLFSGWLRELYGPELLDLLVPKLLWKKVWVVVLPRGSRNTQPCKLELAMYATQQDAQPRTVALWKANVEEPNLNHSAPVVVISNVSSIPRGRRRRRGIMSSQLPRHGPRGARQLRIKLAAVQESDKQLLQSFWNACNGIPQVTHPGFPLSTQYPVLPATAPPALDDVELAMAISASMQPTVHERPILEAELESGSVASTSFTNPMELKAGPSSNEIQHSRTPIETSVICTKVENPIQAPILPSAPIIGNEEIDQGPIHYPSIDTSHVEFFSQYVENVAAAPHEDKEQPNATCVICLDAPIEGACVPCGHMAGCMCCLGDIMGKKWGCPVCRAKIDQVIRLYAV